MTADTQDTGLLTWQVFLDPTACMCVLELTHGTQLCGPCAVLPGLADS